MMRLFIKHNYNFAFCQLCIISNTVVTIRTMYFDLEHCIFAKSCFVRCLQESEIAFLNSLSLLPKTTQAGGQYERKIWTNGISIFIMRAELLNYKTRD